MFEKTIEIVKIIAQNRITKGDITIDTTMGNGHDTLFLSKLTGPEGKVYAFDIQREALRNTKALLEENNAPNNVQLILDGHQHITKYVEEKVSLILFNLGYLPGSNKNCTTKSDTTIAALNSSLTLLDVNGLILIAIYPGHPEGAKEKKNIYSFASNLSQNDYNSFFIDLINQQNNPPNLIGIEKRKKNKIS